MYAAAVLAAASAAYVAAAQSPEPRDNPMIADVMSISVFMAVFFPVFVVLLAFACLRLFRAPDDDPQAPDAASAPEWPRGGGGSRKGGLDASAIAALPLVFFREVRQHRIVDGREDDVLECSVCLLEFDDADALRLLPTCPHAFHPECIGLWLERHSTCPLCRASVLDAPTAPAALLQTATQAQARKGKKRIGLGSSASRGTAARRGGRRCRGPTRRVTAPATTAGWSGSRCGCPSTCTSSCSCRTG